MRENLLRILRADNPYQTEQTMLSHSQQRRIYVQFWSQEEAWFYLTACASGDATWGGHLGPNGRQALFEATGHQVVIRNMKLNESTNPTLSI